MSFSTVLRINDVDDYITPSKSCIRPVKIDTRHGQTKSIRVEQDGTYTALTEDGGAYTLKKATISLNDCLACSGCVTTAESVLISEHSIHSFIEFVRRNRVQSGSALLLAVSLSPQSISSVASELYDEEHVTPASQWFQLWRQEHFPDAKSPALDVVRRFLIDVFRQLGAHIVLDTTWTRDVCLYESAEEFIQLFRASVSSDPLQNLPLFCSVCPGWVCYAEKTLCGSSPVSENATLSQTFSILPHLSTIRSPQQIAGRFVKQINPQHVYHVTVMPCFDKKLEASRSEFATTQSSSIDGNSVPDVDLVLASSELGTLLSLVSPLVSTSDSDENHRDLLIGPAELDAQRQAYLSELAHICYSGELDTTYPYEAPAMYRHMGSGSGGYAAYVFHRAASVLFQLDLTADLAQDDRVLLRQLHNQDVQEMLLFASCEERDAARSALTCLRNSRVPYRSTKAEPSPLLAFAVANGFRNIQNIVQPLKLAYKRQATAKSSRARFPFDYVEVMACPRGCLNGGGQLKGALETTTQAYFQLPEVYPMLEPNVKRIYEYLQRADPDRQSLRTTFRQVPPIEIISPSALQW
ncbi:unnamed protein product [Dicrocoelium dendriticum]|nr:unnamed protein product [Dicrocoelium dendriticum]